MMWTRDRELSEILDGNVAAFERNRIRGTSVPLAGAQQMIVDTIERMERVSFGHTAVADAILDLAVSRAGARRPVRVLEVAAGNGWLTANLAGRAVRRGLEVDLTATDINVDLVDSMRERFEMDGVRATARQADVSNLSEMGDGEVHVAVMSMCLHHLPAEIITASIRELHRVSAGGMVIHDLRRSLVSLLGLPPLAVAVALMGGQGFALHDTAVSVRRAYTAGELEALLTEAGLGASYRVGRLPSRHPERWVTATVWPR